jgi:hypothetical protein
VTRPFISLIPADLAPSIWELETKKAAPPFVFQRYKRLLSTVWSLQSANDFSPPSTLIHSIHSFHLTLTTKPSYSKMFGLTTFVSTLAAVAIVANAKPTYHGPSKTVTITKYPKPTLDSYSQCNQKSTVQCCNKKTHSKDPLVAPLLGLLGIVLGGVDADVGIQCTPVSISLTAFPIANSFHTDQRPWYWFRQPVQLPTRLLPEQPVQWPHCSR